MSGSGELLEKKLKFDENCEKYEKLCDCDVINRDDSSDDDDDDDVITREADDEARNLTSEVCCSCLMTSQCYVSHNFPQSNK